MTAIPDPAGPPDRPCWAPAPGEPFRPLSRSQHSDAYRLQAAGLVRTVLADVLVAVNEPDSPALRLAAAALLLPPGCGAVVGFCSALWLHTGWSPALGPAPQPGPPAVLEVVLPPGRRLRDPAVLTRQVRLEPADWMPLGPLNVTTPARTAADVVRELPEHQGWLALAKLSSATGLTTADVMAQLERMPRTRGVPRARRMRAGR